MGLRDRRAIGGFAGVFLGVFQNTINVDQFEFGFSVFILCMIILGGMGNLAGVILGAVALSMINRFLLPELDTVPEKFGLNSTSPRSRSGSSASCCW